MYGVATVRDSVRDSKGRADYMSIHELLHECHSKSAIVYTRVITRVPPLLHECHCDVSVRCFFLCECEDVAVLANVVCVEVCCNVLQRVAACELQCVAVCCSVLQDAVTLPNAVS